MNTCNEPIATEVRGIPFFRGYAISRNGEVYNLKTSRKMTVTKNTVFIINDLTGTKTSRKVDVLVDMVWNGKNKISVDQV